MRFGSLFSGIGGGDLGLERAGMACAWQCENDKYAIQILERHWPGKLRFGDVRNKGIFEIPPVDVIVGGDPCPTRSLAKGNRRSMHSDLAGYFLAVVGRHVPWWVVRENVRSPDVADFQVGLEILGYDTVVVELDSRDFTAQSRRRQYVIGGLESSRDDLRRVFFDAADGFGFSPSGPQEETPIAACITAHPARLAAEDSYVYEDGRGLRVLSSEEAERLQGFPAGWTAGLSRSRRRILLGNAMTVPVIEWIGKMILEWLKERTP